MIPDAALEIIKHFEGVRLRAYHDCVGFPTIGVGHLLSRVKGASLDQWPDITEDECDNLLRQDAKKAADSVRRLIKVPLTDGQQSALIDFVFNLGGGQLQASTLRAVITRGDIDDAPEQFGKWVYGGGVKLPGLVRRRAAEVQLWSS